MLRRSTVATVKPTTPQHGSSLMRRAYDPLGDSPPESNAGWRTSSSPLFRSRTLSLQARSKSYSQRRACCSAAHISPSNCRLCQPTNGPRPFPEVLPESFAPYRHQQQAWDRLDTRAGRSTIVATGTGSGKTECFSLSDPRSLLPPAWAARNQGDPHLSDERPGHRPGSAAGQDDLAATRNCAAMSLRGSGSAAWSASPPR